MERQFRSFFEVDVELELIEVDSYGWVGIFNHFFTRYIRLKNGPFQREKNILKNLTVRTVK
jgi:hypothetical protein